LRLGAVKNQFCDILGGRVDVHEDVGLAKPAELRNQGIISVENEFVIEVFVDPGADGPFQFAEINCHSQRIETRGLDCHDGFPIVSVQVAALTGIVQKTMTVAEIQLFGDAKHLPSPPGPLSPVEELEGEGNS
jgi:hypothetical protein